MKDNSKEGLPFEKGDAATYDAATLRELINADAHTLSLTVAQMALRDLEQSDVSSAIMRLRVDLDKIVMTNKRLYEYIMRGD